MQQHSTHTFEIIFVMDDVKDVLERKEILDKARERLMEDIRIETIRG